MGKWRKGGVVRLSRSKKVILLSVWGLEPSKWLVVDIEALFDLIAERTLETDILEPED